MRCVVLASSQPSGQPRRGPLGGGGSSAGRKGAGSSPPAGPRSTSPPRVPVPKRSTRAPGVVRARSRRATHVSYTDTLPSSASGTPSTRLHALALEGVVQREEEALAAYIPSQAGAEEHEADEPGRARSGEQASTSSWRRSELGAGAEDAGDVYVRSSRASASKASRRGRPGVARAGKRWGKGRTGAGSSAAGVGGSPAQPGARKRPSARRNSQSSKLGAVSAEVLLQARSERVAKQAPGRAPTQAREGKDAPVLEGQELLNRLHRTMRLAKLNAKRGRTSVNGGDSSAVGMLMASMGALPLLTRAEEAGLSKMIQAGVALREERAAAAEKGLPSPAQTRDTARIEAEAVAAKRLLVAYNHRLVISIAKRYAGKGVPLADLIPEGIFGLDTATEKFEAERGFKFSTYAHWWIRQAVSRSITNQSRIVRLPVHVYDHVSRIARAQDELARDPARAAEDRAPSAEEIGAHLGLAPSKVHAYMRAARLPRSLEAPATVGARAKSDDANCELLLDSIAEDEGQGLADRLAEAAAAECVEQDVSRMLSTLHPRERNVLRMRYGLHARNGAPMTLAEVGAAYGLTCTKVRQIEARALRKLRRPWRLALVTQHASGGL